LAVVDHTALMDLGMTSVGHRLQVLRGVWELKREQGLEMGEDDWRPQGESPLLLSSDMSSREADVDVDGMTNGPAAPVQAGQIDRLWDLILEQRK
jgi:hypothetical protein